MGMVCDDGAKSSCARRLNCTAGEAYTAMLLAMNGADFSSRQGVISPDFSENLRAIGELSGVGFAAVDAVMLKLLMIEGR